MADRDFDSKDGNFTQLMNELIVKLQSYKLDSNEYLVFWTVVGRTWTFRKAWSRIRWDYFSEKTRLSGASLSYARSKLTARNVLHTKPYQRIKKAISYKINSKLSTWIEEADLEPIWQSKAKKLVQPVEPSKTLKLVQPVEPNWFNPLNQLVQPVEPTPIKRNPLKKTIKDTPSDSPTKRKKPAKKKSAANPQEKERACSLPAGFNLSLENEKYAVMKGIDIKKVDDFFDSFLNWANAKGIKCVDWEAQFKTHVDNAPRFGRQYMIKTPTKRRKKP